MLTFNEQDQNVADFLSKIGVEYRPVFVANMDHDKEWQHDLFQISFVKSGKVLNVPYKTGIGHRVSDTGKIVKTSPSDQRTLKKIKATLTGLSNPAMILSARATYPTSASVLYCLLADLSLSEYGFSDFCASCGYDEDSRKALDIYLQCEKQSSELKSFFTSEQLEQLTEILEDY